MVTVKPLKDADSISQMFDAHSIELCDGAVAMIAVEGDKEVGSAVFSMIGTELTVLSVKYPKEDIYICDLVSRAVMNYGVNRGAMFCEIVPTAPVKEFYLLGFIKSVDETSIDIIKTFTMCTKCKNN